MATSLRRPDASLPDIMKLLALCKTVSNGSALVEAELLQRLATSTLGDIATLYERMQTTTAALAAAIEDPPAPVPLEFGQMVVSNVCDLIDERQEELAWHAANRPATCTTEVTAKAAVLRLLVGEEKTDLVDQLARSLCDDILRLANSK